MGEQFGKKKLHKKSSGGGGGGNHTEVNKRKKRVMLIDKILACTITIMIIKPHSLPLPPPTHRLIIKRSGHNATREPEFEKSRKSFD